MRIRDKPFFDVDRDAPLYYLVGQVDVVKIKQGMSNIYDVTRMT